MIYFQIKPALHSWYCCNQMRGFCLPLSILGVFYFILKIVDTITEVFTTLPCPSVRPGFKAQSSRSREERRRGKGGGRARRQARSPTACPGVALSRRLWLEPPGASVSASSKGSWWWPSSGPAAACVGAPRGPLLRNEGNKPCCQDSCIQ